MGNANGKDSLIVTITDFGLEGPYIGQMESAIYSESPSARVINLLADAPSFDPLATSYLLPAYTKYFPLEAIFLCVVDPGVGTQERQPIVATIGGRRFVGPGNGLFDILAISDTSAVYNEILWHPDSLSSSFHGRDLFAPVAAKLANDSLPSGWLSPPFTFDIKEGISLDYKKVIYIDKYGNVVTGIRGESIDRACNLEISTCVVEWATTFGDVTKGELFWYVNSNGLVEIAANGKSASALLSISVGDSVLVL